MSIASNITALVTAIATAINGRGATGASDYQMWLAQGNTGTLADYRASLVGADEDYAAYFNGLLGAVASPGVATAAQAGITQLATTAEAAAATSTSKAITPAGALVLARSNPLTFTTLALLFATTPQEGALATVQRYAFSSGVFHHESVWVGRSGQWIPVGGFAYVEAADRAGALQASAGISAAAAATGSVGSIPIGTITLNVAGTTRERFRWSGSAWVLDNPPPFQAFNYNSAQSVNGFARVTGFSTTHPDWDDTNKIWTAPADGSYLLSGTVRWADAVSGTNNNLGVEVMPVGQGAQSTLMTWGSPPGTNVTNGRFTQQHTRLYTTTKGATMMLGCYANATAIINGCEFTIIRVA